MSARKGLFPLSRAITPVLLAIYAHWGWQRGLKLKSSTWWWANCKYILGCGDNHIDKKQEQCASWHLTNISKYDMLCFTFRYPGEEPFLFDFATGWWWTSPMVLVMVLEPSGPCWWASMLVSPCSCWLSASMLGPSPLSPITITHTDHKRITCLWFSTSPTACNEILSLQGVANHRTAGRTFLWSLFQELSFLNCLEIIQGACRH